MNFQIMKKLECYVTMSLRSIVAGCVFTASLPAQAVVLTNFEVIGTTSSDGFYTVTFWDDKTPAIAGIEGAQPTADDIWGVYDTFAGTFSTGSGLAGHAPLFWDNANDAQIVASLLIEVLGSTGQSTDRRNSDSFRLPYADAQTSGDTVKVFYDADNFPDVDHIVAPSQNASVDVAYAFRPWVSFDVENAQTVPEPQSGALMAFFLLLYSCRKRLSAVCDFRVSRV